MSHSRIFDEYAKLMSEKGLLKTAEKKDEDYNTVPASAGPDTKVEKSGYELTEIAHPEQIQVAESRLNDGIVENGVEKQKAMIDVALRNPRGVLASELIQTLVKVANTLDEELTEDSLKLSAEIDALIAKIAQDNFFNSEVQFQSLLSAAEEVIKEFADVKIRSGFAQYGLSDELEKFTAQLRRYVAMAKTISPDQKKRWTQTVAAIVRANENTVEGIISSGTTGWFFQTEAVKAKRAWRDLVSQSEGIAAIEDKSQQSTTEEERKPNWQTIPKVQPQGGAASKKPGMHNYSVFGDEVKELQQLLGFTGNNVDGKFGQHTFDALQSAAKNNSLLAQLVDNMPKSYQGWKNENIGEAINRIKAGNTGAQKQPAKQPYETEQHFTASGLGIPYENEK